ncbi:GspE/PulE family protein [Anaeromyxobacter sp. Fw109-5]|uniref:GspE/PulE family protein n=1 Tax=Anaeromyxobacter sp. (strain Fw109-5) TaxID=404589 RepID=UPI0000ED741E|nr:GspE/PulE family protein [Anaeromyxobacter sp. Fw109-5]ABS26682.1 type II secretion system protein E [Anaeromyxobacter sp. Fw109-5]
MPRTYHATDYTLEFVADLLARQGILTDDAKRTAFARENVQRARLLRDHASRAGGRGLRRAELSPIEVLASFGFTDARQESEVVDEDKATQAVAQAVGVPYRKIDPLKLDAQLITRTLSRPFARRHGVLPLERRNGALVVAAANPFDRELFENLRGLTGAEIEPVLSSPADIHRAIAEVYGFRQQISEARTQLEQSDAAPDVANLEQFVNLSGIEALEASSEPVIAAVEYLLHYAFEQRASDIHLEPRREESIIRMRIDGVLHPVHRIPKAVHGAIANRFKIMSRLDIAMRRPQDGRIRTARGDAEMELRVSTMPTTFGDKVVVRVLDPTVLVRDLSELGFLPDERDALERWLVRPHGLVVVTGPTGSGKTTTLYSALQALASPEVNVVTIEDPIEMVHEEFNQIAANARTGTGFAEALRHVLRQDPDVIMVGEIRDGETAAQAVQAALTGHMVLTTLHTNDTVSAVARLRDLGVPSFLVAATLTGVVAQRLVRQVCPSCAADVPLTADEIHALSVPHPEDHAGQLLGRRGQGCAKCRFTGFYGRTGIFEVLPVNARLRHLVAEGATPEVLARTARQDGLRSLRDHAVRKIASGVTSFEEAFRATADAEASA